jgi:hypothetical protein
VFRYNPFDAEVIANPHAFYPRLREEAPCYYIEEWDAFALSRFEDIWQASMDAERYTATRGTSAAHLITKVQPVTPMLNLMDPPAHTQLRARISKFFTPGAVRKLEAQIRRIADEAFAPLVGRRGADLFNDFAAVVSVRVACLANGFPMEDADALNRLVWRFFAREEGVDGMTQDGVAAMVELADYFAALIQRRRAAGVSDGSVVDVVLGIELGGRRFTDEEAGSHLSMFLIGGAETFPKVFASAVHRLWQHPDQRARCARDRALVPGAFAEVLRYDMPTQFLMRQVLREHALHGQRLSPGQSILMLYPSGNRDPREFPDPDRFDIDRRPARILSFGHGIHACIGQHFAKLEGAICLEKLLDFAPEYAVEESQLRRIRTEYVQGWETLPVVFGRN